MSKTQRLSENANNFLSLEETRNGQNTIKVNGIYLHSKYDPIKEAISFVNANIEEDQNTSGYLVLGLGLGYHVAELANRTNKQITVLEPNKELYNLPMMFVVLKHSRKLMSITILKLMIFFSIKHL